MSKLLKLIVVIGLIVYFIAQVVRATPAQLVTANLVKALPMLQLSVVSGTAWKGHAAEAVIDIKGEPLSLGKLRWRFQPTSLFALKACVDVKNDVFSGVLCRTLLGVNQLERFKADVPASLANRFTKEAEFAGAASLAIVQGELDDKGNVAKLKGTMSLQGARVQFQGQWFDLGDYGADLSEAGGGAVNAAVFDLAGPLGVKLNAVVGVETAPSVSGTVMPKPSAPGEISIALGLFGVAQDDGAFAITYPMGG